MFVKIHNTMKTAGTNMRMYAGYKDTEVNFITTRITANGVTVIWAGALTAIRTKNQKIIITHGAGKHTDLQHHGNAGNAAYAIRRIFANDVIPARNLWVIRHHGVEEIPKTDTVSTAIFLYQLLHAQYAIPVQRILRLMIRPTWSNIHVHAKSVILYARLVRRRTMIPG